MRPTLALLVAAALLAGCATPGSALTGGQLERLSQGMTREDTLRLLGAPDATMRFAPTRTEAWDYRYQDPWGYLADFSVTFGPDGRVVSMMSQRINDGGDHR